MANAFSKEEIVEFEDLLEKFDDQLVLSNAVKVKKTDQTQMERSSDTIWRPYPYILDSFNGLDQTANFTDVAQLSVPARINQLKSVPWNLTALQRRDALQEGRLLDAAKQKLASDINVAVNNVAALTGSLVVKRTVAASGFDDVAQAEAIFNEQGIPSWDRWLALSTRDYNGAASNLAGRQTMQGKPTTAYEKALVGSGIANFDILKMDYTPRLAAAAGTTVTINGAGQNYVPAATYVDTQGGINNVDNRFQVISVTVGGGTVKVGDSFTIAGVNAVHHITKGDTGQLKTFRITRIVTGSGGTGTIEITPPIISASGGTRPERQYQNVTATPANGAAVTFLNTQAAYLNPFWQKDSIEILPGRVAVDTDSGLGVLRGTTAQGFELVLSKQTNINDLSTKYRVDTYFGVVNLNPEMNGVILFNQT